MKLKERFRLFSSRFQIYNLISRSKSTTIKVDFDLNKGLVGKLRVLESVRLLQVHHKIC